MRTIQFDYHQLTFRYLMEKLASKIEAELIQKPAAFRAAKLLASLPIEKELSAREAWPVAKKLLDDIEGEIAKALSHRSVVFWIHLYRRIGVLLSPHHEGQTDARTVGLVRSIVELAIKKHGRVGDAAEMSVSSRINPDLVLGGFIRRSFYSLAPRKPSRAWKRFVAMFKAAPQWVIRDFDETDFLAIHSAEGFAY